METLNPLLKSHGSAHYMQKKNNKLIKRGYVPSHSDFPHDKASILCINDL